MRFGRIIVGLALAFVSVTGAALAQGPSWDNSGNNLLSGNTYYFRQVYYSPLDNNGDLGVEFALYGNISFSANGTYTLANANLIQYYVNNGSVVGPTSSTYSLPSPGTGTYSISSSGFGFLSGLFCPFSTCSTNSVYVTISHGILIGSSTEARDSQYDYINDLFIATQVPPTLANNATFSGAWNMAGYIPPPIGNFPAAEDAGDVFFTMNPNGGGSLGTVNVVGYNVYLNGGSTTTQTASNLSYSFSNGAASIVFPNNNSSYFFAGTELLYFSPDGTFCFGGSTGYPDMLVGVKAPTSGAPSLSGVYATAGISEDESQAANGFVDLQTFYGSLVSQVNNSSYIVENDRINDPFEYYTYSSGYYDLASGIEGSGIYSNGYIKFALNQSGTVRIGAGIGLNPSPLIGLSVAVQVPTLTGSGIVLYPTGVQDNASYAPFTTGISGGQFLTLYGSGFTTQTALASTLPLPTTLGGVQVMVDGIPAPIDYVSPSQINLVVPFEISNFSVATIKVVNGSASSNTVTELVRPATPGVFGNIGSAAAIHDSGFAPVTQGNPAQPGETIDLYVGGLGSLYPPAADGAAGVGSATTNLIQVLIGGVAANVYYQGQAPGYAGLYQLQVVVPSTLSSGLQNVEVDACDNSGLIVSNNCADSNGYVRLQFASAESYIYVGSGAAARTVEETPSVVRRKVRPTTPGVNNTRRPMPAVVNLPKAASSL